MTLPHSSAVHALTPDFLSGKDAEKPDVCARALCSVIANYEKELEGHRAIEASLGKSILRDAELLHQKDELLRQKDVLAREAEHRLLNGLQLVKSVLTMQSRSTDDPEVARTLKDAANRVSILARVHQRLHSVEDLEDIDFRQYLGTLCHDLSDLVSLGSTGRTLRVGGVEMTLPRRIATPLAFIASELITNSMKYAQGEIEVDLLWLPNGDGELSVSDDGPGLPEAFDPTETKSLGMKIITAFARQIQAEVTFGKGDKATGTRFSIVFRTQPKSNAPATA